MLLARGISRFFTQRGFWLPPTLPEEILHNHNPARNRGPSHAPATLKLGEGVERNFEPEADNLSQNRMLKKYAIIWGRRARYLRRCARKKAWIIPIELSPYCNTHYLRTTNY